MLKMQLTVLLAALPVGRTILPPYTGSEDQPPNGNHLLLTVSWRFSRCWILVFGDIAQGSHNPADLPSRGLSVSQLRESQLWWKEPSWLQELEKDWPKDLRSKSPNEGVQVERESKAIGSCVVQTREPFIDYARFSK